jgi:acyl carrier protein
MTDAEIKEKIFGILAKIAPEADFDQLAPDEKIQEALDIDSFDFLNFIIGLSEDLKVEIPESDYEQILTLADIVGYLSVRLG